MAHQAEIVLNRTGEQPSAETDRWAAIAAILDEVEEYRRVFHEVLGGDVVSTTNASASLPAFIGHMVPIIRRTLAESGLELASIAVNDAVVMWQPEFFRALQSMLTHVLNNAVDHGYVFPMLRGQAQPPAALSISASVADDTVAITVDDEGAGIDLAGLARVARERGVYDQFAGDLTAIAFEEGISSAEVLTISSGRGIGLAAVRTMARELGGDVALLPHLPRGTRVRITVPFALAALTPKVSLRPRSA